MPIACRPLNEFQFCKTHRQRTRKEREREKTSGIWYLPTRYRMFLDHLANSRRIIRRSAIHAGKQQLLVAVSQETRRDDERREEAKLQQNDLLSRKRREREKERVRSVVER